jgi:hypothetical protein
MSIQPDDLDAEEMEVLRRALSESRIRSGPSAEFAADLRSRLLSVAVAVQPVRERSKRRIVIASCFAAGLSVVVLGAVWFFNSEPAWASAIRKARGQACIHARIVRDNVQKGELWVSPGMDVVASIFGTTTRLSDYRHRVFLQYESKENAVYTSFEPEDVHLTRELSSVPNLAEVFRRSPSAPSLLPNEPIERWTLKSKMVDGIPCDEYEIAVRSPHRSATTLVITIDKRSSLPYSFAITESAAHTTICYFDYPSEGRLDEASLGIPEAAERREVDQSGGELSRIKQTLQEGREAFDDYAAVSATSHFDGPLPLMRCESKRVLRKGLKWRIDSVQLVDPKVVLPADQSSALQVWQANKNRFHFSPWAICDGNTIFAFEWNGKVSKDGGPLRTFSVQGESQADFLGSNLLVPERSCRPTFRGGPLDHLFEVKHVMADGEDLVKVDMSLSRKPQNPKILDVTYWLDPGLGDVVKRIEFRHTATADGQVPKSSSPSEVVFQEFNQSPNGFWYPTVIVRDPTDKNKKRTTRLYVDFTDIPSDDLFRISK